MKILWNCRSTNGRWGMTIVGPGEYSDEWPRKGTLTSLGKIEGKSTYKFSPDDGGNWILPGGDLEPLAGCVTIEQMDLQSSSVGTIIAGGEFFAVRESGYKGRSSWITAYKAGQKIDLPAPVLAAMGLLPCEEEVIKVEIPDLDSPLAAALKKAGLA